jgi:hypothetical protein
MGETRRKRSSVELRTDYLALSGSPDPLSGSPAFSVRDCAAISRTLARIASNGRTPANVSSPNRHRPFGPGRGNGSSCPVADVRHT